MSATIIVLLLVPPGEGQGPLVSGIVGAATRSLGVDSRVLVDSRAAASDDDAVILADRLHANGVVTLRWLDGGRVSLHAHWTGQTGWTDRAFTFRESDALDERGRTIGFALAAMVRIGVPAAAAPPETKPPESREPTKERAPEPKTRAAPPAPPPSWASHRFSLEAAGAVHAGTDTVAWGGTVRAGMRVAPAVTVTAGAGFRTGTVGALDGRLYLVSLAGGVRVPLLVDNAYEVGLRAEFVASRSTLDRTGTAGDAQSDSRWLPGAHLQMSGAWFFTSRVAAVAALGAQMDFGSTDVVVNGRMVTTLSPFHGTGELGARFLF